MQTKTAPITALLCMVIVSLIGLWGCLEKSGTNPSPNTGNKAYVERGGIYLAGDSVWVKWTTAHNASTAKVSFCFLRMDDSLEYVLPILERGIKEAKVIIPNSNYTDIYNSYSKIEIRDTASTLAAHVIDSLNVKYVVLLAPNGNDTVMIGDTVMVSWRSTPGKLAGVRLLMDLNDSPFEWKDLVAIPADPTGTWDWIVGQERVTVAYPTDSCRIAVGSYNSGDILDMSDNFISVHQ